MPFSGSQSTDESRRNQENKNEAEKGVEATVLSSSEEFLTPVPNAVAAASVALQQQLLQQRTPSTMLRQVLQQQLNPPIHLQQESPHELSLNLNLPIFQKLQQQKILQESFQSQPPQRQHQRRQLQQNELEMLLLLQIQLNRNQQSSIQYLSRQTHQSEIADHTPISNRNQQVSSLRNRDFPRILSAGLSLPRVDNEASLSSPQSPGIFMPDSFLAALVAEKNGAQSISTTTTTTPRLSDTAFQLRDRQQQQQLAILLTEYLSSSASFPSRPYSGSRAESKLPPASVETSTPTHQRQQPFLSQESSHQHSHYLLDLTAQLQQQQAAWRQSQESSRKGADSGGAGARTTAAQAISAQNKIVNAPEKPKRPLSAYNFFFKDERAKMLDDLLVQKEDSDDKQDHDGAQVASLQQSRSKRKKKKRIRSKGRKTISFEEMARCIGKKWHSVDLETKTRYQRLADQEKERYNLEKIAFLKFQREHREQSHVQLQATVDEATRKKYLEEWSGSGGGKKELNFRK